MYYVVSRPLSPSLLQRYSPALTWKEDPEEHALEYTVGCCMAW